MRNSIRTPWFALSRHDEGAEGAPSGSEGGTEGGDGKPADKPAATFTQDQLDAIIKDRLGRQKAQFADYDDVKAKAAKLDEIESASKSELEREREARTRAEEAAATAARTAAERIAAAEVKAALTGLVDDPSIIIEDLNLGRYVTAEGDVDTEAVARLREKYQGLVKPSGRPQGDIDQGKRGDDKPLDLRTADASSFQAELGKYGLRPRH